MCSMLGCVFLVLGRYIIGNLRLLGFYVVFEGFFNLNRLYMVSGSLCMCILRNLGKRLGVILGLMDSLFIFLWRWLVCCLILEVYRISGWFVCDLFF